MDLGFPKLDAASALATPFGLDHRSLIAALAAAQATSRTATAEAQSGTDAPVPAHPLDALVTIIEGAPGWAVSVSVLRGSFHPEAARLLDDKEP